MKISVIVTTYNAEAYIIDTLKSVVNQTYQNIEIIIVDDGSTDNTIKKIQTYMNEISFEKFNLYLRPHIGRSSALNYALNVANYEWIAIIDADDLWNINKLELQVRYMEKYNIDFSATQSRIFSADAEVNIFESSENQQLIDAKMIEITLDKMLYANFIAHSSVITRKSYLKYAIKRKSQVDYEMWLRLLSEGKKIYLLDQCLLYHRIHPNQSFEAKNRLRYALNATLLQLKYCMFSVKLIPAIFALLKLIYYIFLPRKIRFLIRDFIIG